MKKCPICKGYGKIDMEVISEDDIEKKNIKIACRSCEGEGYVSPEKYERIKYEKNMWCKCKLDHGAKYYENGQHEILFKQHWRCKKCGKVLRIG